MSTLLVDELYPGVTFVQKFKVNRDTNLAHVRPWIYKHGTLVDGDFQLEVKQGATTLVTKTLNFATINAAFTETFAHGYIRFDFDALSLRVAQGNTEEEYELHFSMINHTQDTNNFLGIVREWDGRKYTIYGDDLVNGQPPNDAVEPGGFELFEYTHY